MLARLFIFICIRTINVALPLSDGGVRFTVLFM